MNRFEYYSKVQEYQENHIEHHGIIGQKWGQRRWQNPDGTYTEEGKKRYFGSDDSNLNKTDEKKHKEFEKSLAKSKGFNLKYQNAAGSLTLKGIELAKKAESGDPKAIEELRKNINIDYYKKSAIDDTKDITKIFSKEEPKNDFNNKTEEDKVSGLFNKNLSKESKDKKREKLYSRDSEMLTIDKLYNKDEQKYLLNKKVSKKVNKLVDCLTKGDFDEYNKILEDIDSKHLQTVKNAAHDLANTKQLRNVDSSRLIELSKDIFGNDYVLGVQSILATTNSNDINAHSTNRVYPVDVRQSIIDNSTLLKTAILEYEKGNKDGYERDIQIASGGDERRAKYMKQFVDDIEAAKEYSKDSKEINNEIRKLKTKESCDDNAFVDYHYTEAAYNNIYKYIDDDFPTRLKKGTNDAKKVANNLYKNFEKYSKEFKENLYYQLLDYYDDEYISKSEFMKEIGKTNAVEMYGNGDVSFTYSVPGEMGYDVVSINGNIDDSGKLIVNDVDFID